MKSVHHPLKIALSSVLIVSLLTTTGCASMSGLFGKKKKSDVIATAEQSEEQYYAQAQRALEKSHNNEAILALNNIRTFYPTGAYAQQALLDLIYAQYQSGDYESVTKNTAEFIRLYPTSQHLDYALYVQGVTNMGGAPKASRLFKSDQAQRNTAYLRLAFNDFQTLISNFPNSPYAADAAQRMIAIYNDLAENELVAARWYVKRDAMVAAANRAKWAFQYFPQSTAVPEAIAILAYANDKLGLTDTANQYKTLLQINYPQYLNSNGSVRVNTDNQSLTKKALSTLTFGKLGRIKHDAGYQGQYTGETRTQVIRQAGMLSLPEVNVPQDSEESQETPRRRPSLNLGLPSQEANAGHLNDKPQ
ncbi:outer membrane protein assembly factor BamD [Moraxella nasicaprae]|uniref:Outer membrane protein assembly factor BamD n=1 Tax=Moraxella nasicaprae TaxID=2904122 RepID=A0ABY6F4F8_9GAMM|nr:outer membrane protein assembly factor BamD [Moraxella nasicaprae]UXZ04964.1 outer membrane protein assembly factor BamD [Moraxella nasicaprae]